MKELIELSEKNQKTAWEIIKETKVVKLWEEAGARVHLVGSLKMGLMMKHRDIDFHIYSKELDIQKSFSIVQKMAENPAVKRIEYINLIDTEEKCIEWHAWYQDREGKLWQIDMIHILEGSEYDGYIENVNRRIIEVITREQKEIILKLKYETPDDLKISGIEYYQAGEKITR